MTTNSTPLELQPLILPAVPSWFPLAWGWWASFASVVVALLLLTAFFLWRKKRLKAKRAALKLFVKPITPHTPSSAIELLRQAALCYYTREAIASLHGEQWYQFLDLQLGETRFSDKMPLWQAALYQNKHGEHDSELVNDCLVWVEKALPPKRGMRG
ncbi:DUF4381 domain-containing protein [Vibrio vulnificus]|nr:DUF4381 domain-containing protein [Vibrio vulnificus]MCU8172526.1 DUF4381 domain-containing protein [Vibrio vulnificus]